MKLNREKYKDIEITKDVVQNTALQYWIENDFHGACFMATGTGKSRVGILASRFIKDNLKEILPDHISNILLVVPTEKLRDENWMEEFEEWGGMDIWNENLQRTCYSSLNKYKDQEWDLIILDEAHHITPLNSEFFYKNNNTVHAVLSLTATQPEDKEKKALLREISPVVFVYDLEEAEEDGLVAPFDLIIIKAKLDNVTKNIEAGSKVKRWFQTEQDKYDYLTNTIEDLRIKKAEELGNINIDQVRYKDYISGGTGYPPLEVEKFELYKYKYQSYEKRLMMMILNRMQFLQSLTTKTNLAKRVLKKIHEGKGKRTIVFGGSIPQVNEICGNRVFHSQSDKEKDKKLKNTAFDRFKRLEDDLLGVVKALNEGHSIPLVDQALVVQLNSKELDIIQRIGRIIRYRDGHTGVIYIIVIEDTVDWNWFKSSMKSFSKLKFKYVDASIYDEVEV